jgi:hypothetical protein
MNAIDMEIETKVKDVEMMESELKALQAEWDKEDAAEATEHSKTIKMICNHACEKCGSCEDAIPQEVEENNEDLIEILQTPCDCEIMETEVKHVIVS